MRFFLLLVIFLGSACSWQGLAHTAQDQLATWRLVDNHTPSKDFRWRLPMNSQLQNVTNSSAKGQGLKPWNTAAQQGVERVFTPAYAASTRFESPTYLLRVAWPVTTETNQPSNSTTQGTFSILGLHSWPTLSRTGTLRVHLLAETGEPIYQADLKLSPKLWSRDWHDEQVIEDAFFQLAVGLRGS